MTQIQIGNATLYLGDCRQILPGLLVKEDVVITDPPYGTGGWRRTAAGMGSNPAAKLIREAWDDGLLDWLPLAGCPVVSFWPSAHMPELMTAAKAAGFVKYRMLYMRKMDPKPQMAGRIAWSVEPIVCMSPDGFQLYGGTDFIEASSPRMNRDRDATGHPYQKPAEVMSWLVSKVRGARIADPFMGSGTTGVACAQAGRPFVGIEAERKWFDVACERIAAANSQAQLFGALDQHAPGLKQSDFGI